ncbi:MAG TPA: SRPBCC family protein [Pyrinomonadaceae bacterium]|nr:SRPBCC family protein [Pyrinomonadaceae bacterium]
MSFNQEILSANNPNSANRDESGNINVGEIERVVCAVAGGALAVYGFRNRTLKGLLLTVAGTALLHRGATGHCNTYDLLGIRTSGDKTRNETSEPVAKDIHIEKSITIGKSPSELYNFWRDFENLPKFMTHLESVRCVGLNRSHWIAKGPAGKLVEWDAEVYNEKPNELIAWRSLEGEVTNAGSVRFEDAGERGTVVRVVLNYNAPGGKLSAFVAKLLGGEPGQMIEDDLRRLKQILEAGEIANVEGQPSGRDSQARPARTPETPIENTGEQVKSRAATSLG